MLTTGAIGQECTEVVCAKSQWVRAADVFVIGPVMVWGGTKLLRKHPVAGGALAAFGVLTVIFNARNWLDTQRVQQGA